VLKDLDFDLTRMSEKEIEELVQAFQANTDIKVDINRTNRRDMDMFVVSLKDKNPAVARDYVNALVRRYIEENLSSSRDETYGASKFLLEQIDLFKNKINAIEVKIADISQQKGSANQERLIALQKKLDELLLQYTENHPEVVKVHDEIETLKRQVRGSRRILVDDQTAQTDKEIKSELGEARTASRAPAERGNEQKIKELERDRDVYRKIYEDMLAALGRSEVSSHIEVQDKGGTFNILEPAVLPLMPVGSNRIKIILLGIIAGIGAGIGTIILLDSLDKSVKTVETLNGFGFPVLAVIPHISIPAEIKNTRIKDLALYTFTGIYYMGVAAVLAFEFLGKEIK
jgi:polysaccharide biosynthesis transport protein